MNPKTRIQQIVEDNPIYQQLDAANQRPGRLHTMKARRVYVPGQTDQTTQRNSLTDALISYTFGFTGMLILASVLAASFNYRILFGFQNGSFEALPTGLVITLLYPLLFVVFGLIAYISKTWTFAFYPVAMLALTGLFADNSFIYWLAGWLPLADVLNIGLPVFSLYAFVAITLMIMLIYMVEKPVREITASRQPRANTLFYRGGLLAVLLMVAAASVLGRPLHQQVLQSRAAVHLPNTSTVSAFNPTDDGYKIAYEQPDTIIQFNYDILKVSTVQDWWHRDTAGVCGKAIVPAANQPALDFIYRTTNTGTAYATALSGDTEYVCFAVGYQRYDLQRDIKSYRYIHNSTGQVVSLISDAPRYVLFCDESHALPRPNRDQRRIAADACTAQNAADYSSTLYKRTVEAN